MGRRYLEKIGNKSYIIELYDESVIANYPYAATWFIPPRIPHRSTFFKITYIEEGEADVEFFSRKGGEIKTVSLKSKDAFIITPDDIHIYHTNLKTKYCHKDIYISQDLMKKCCDMIREGLYEDITGGEYPNVFRLSTTAITSISEMMMTIVFEPLSETNSAIHKSIIMFLLGQYIAIKEYFNNYPKWMKNLLRNLDKESYLIMPIEELVNGTGFSHSYVSAQFKNYMGMSLKKYVNKSKLSFAAAMLSSSDCSIEDIVERLDFNTPSNFINLFKAEFGVTPGKYRSMHKKVTK